nr:hypothetical protein [Chloroflexota bacterium]
DFVIFAGFRGFRDPKAHEATAAGDTAQVKEIEAEIDRLAAGLWGLSYGCYPRSEEDVESSDWYSSTSKKGGPPASTRAGGFLGVAKGGEVWYTIWVSRQRL